MTLFCVIIILSQVLHKGMYRYVAWHTFLASIVHRGAPAAMNHGIGTSREGCWGPPVWAAWGGAALPGVGGSYRGLLPAGPPLEKRVSSVSAFPPGPSVPRPLEPWLGSASSFAAGYYGVRQVIGYLEPHWNRWPICQVLASLTSLFCKLGTLARSAFECVSHSFKGSLHGVFMSIAPTRIRISFC